MRALMMAAAREPQRRREMKTHDVRNRERTVTITVAERCTYEVRPLGGVAWEDGMVTLADAIASLREAEKVASGPRYEIARRWEDGDVDVVSLDEIADEYASMQ